jgi:hypothetical protein
VTFHTKGGVGGPKVWRSVAHVHLLKEFAAWSQSGLEGFGVKSTV